MKLAIFGGTGKTGKPLVEQALAQGHQVTALVRTPSKLPIQSDDLILVQGDATDPYDVDRVIIGADAVLSALGHAKGSPDDVQTVATEHIVTAMKRRGVERIVSLTGAGVKDPNDEPKLADKVIRFLLKTFAGRVLEDAKNHAEVLRKSGLQWTIVRGPRLTNGPHTGEYRVGYVGKNSSTQISHADTADFMLKEVTDNAYIHKAPVVST